MSQIQHITGAGVGAGVEPCASIGIGGGTGICDDYVRVPTAVRVLATVRVSA